MDAGFANPEATAMGSVVGDHLVFRTDYWFFVAAAAVEVMCILFILPTYHGWWRLGRSVSLSPLETAKVGYIHD